MRRRRTTDLIGLGILSILLLNCSGGAMSETESDSVSTESAQPSPQPTDAPVQTVADEPADVDAASYREALAESILSTWTQPRRANNTPPRIAVVTVYLGPNGQLVRWDWRRRSPVGRFNDLVAEYMDELVSTLQQHPLPPEGSPLWVEVLEQGVAIEFADSDA